MREIMERLMELQALELGPRKNADLSARERLRNGIPDMVLGHFDRLVTRGKRGVSVIRQGVCTECHLRLPLGTLLTLARGEDIQLCGNCARYLYLPVEEIPGRASEKAEEAKRPSRAVRKGQKRGRRSLLMPVS